MEVNRRKKGWKEMRMLAYACIGSKRSFSESCFPVSQRVRNEEQCKDSFHNFKFHSPQLLFFYPTSVPNFSSHEAPVLRAVAASEVQPYRFGR
jgi:hypothetical protein